MALTGNIKVRYKKGGIVPKTKIERIREIEKELAKLKADVEREEKPDYPYVGIETRGRIALFYGEHSRENKTIYGDECVNPGWIESCFTPFTGTIEYKDGKPV